MDLANTGAKSFAIHSGSFFLTVSVSLDAWELLGGMPSSSKFIPSRNFVMS